MIGRCAGRTCSTGPPCVPSLARQLTRKPFARKAHSSRTQSMTLLLRAEPPEHAAFAVMELPVRDRGRGCRARPGVGVPQQDRWDRSAMAVHCTLATIILIFTNFLLLRTCVLYCRLKMAGDDSDDGDDNSSETNEVALCSRRMATKPTMTMMTFDCRRCRT